MYGENSADLWHSVKALRWWPNDPWSCEDVQIRSKIPSTVHHINIHLDVVKVAWCVAAKGCSYLHNVKPFQTLTQPLTRWHEWWTWVYGGHSDLVTRSKPFHNTFSKGILRYLGGLRWLNWPFQARCKSMPPLLLATLSCSTLNSLFTVMHKNLRSHLTVKKLFTKCFFKLTKGLISHDVLNLSDQPSFASPGRFISHCKRMCVLSGLLIFIHSRRPERGLSPSIMSKRPLTPL